MDSHYPSTAELVAFRAWLLSSDPAIGNESLRQLHPVSDDGPVFTWEGELREGIGWSASQEWPLLRSDPVTTDARRKASAIRAAAYHRAANGWRDATAVTVGDVETFAPGAPLA